MGTCGNSRDLDGRGKGHKGVGEGQNGGGSFWATPMTPEKTPVPILPTPKPTAWVRGAAWREGPGMVKRERLEKGGRLFWEFWFIFKPGQGRREGQKEGRR